MGSFDLLRFPDPQHLAQTAARDWLTELSLGGPGNSPFSAALMGGRIAKSFFSSVAALAVTQRSLFDPVHFFWSDERCVPPTDNESNFRPAQELLLQPLNISPKQIHRICGEEPPAEAAGKAESELRQVLQVQAPAQPVLDLVLLGMGEDGHVASLFPGEPQEAVTGTAVFRPALSPKPPPWRVTMGFAAIAAARRVWVLVSGPTKQDALRQSLAREGGTPLAHVLALRDSTRIYSDCQI